MQENSLRRLLEELRSGAIDLDAAVARLKGLPFASLADATVDTHRALRQGMPEAVFAEGKTVEQTVDIAMSLHAANGAVLCTRVKPEQAAALSKALPAGTHDPVSRTFRAGLVEAAPRRGQIAVVTAGTSDRPVAEEAAVTAEFLGNEVRRVSDVGVAGLHRLAARREELESSSVVVVLAGMEGALASVVAGMVSKPVIAVPTSVGYGASFGGLAALLAMLSSCAAGVGVVNIDNGFGAAVLASNVNRA
jgi:NCAIR mutase (PurE)-related protein